MQIYTVDLEPGSANEGQIEHALMMEEGKSTRRSKARPLRLLRHVVGANNLAATNGTMELTKYASYHT